MGRIGEITKNFFSQLFFSTFAGKERRKGRRGRKIALYSRFGHFLEDLDEEDALYRVAIEAVGLCDEGVSVTSARLLTIDRLKKVEEEMAELECYNKMTMEDAARLKDLLERFAALGKDKNELKYQITGFDSSITKMAALEEEAPKAITEIRDAEGRRRAFGRDVDSLKGEKEDLEYELESLQNSGDFVYKFTIGIVVVFVFAATVLVMLHIFRDLSVFAPLAALTVLAVIAVAALTAMRRRIVYELKMNVLKRKKAVGMINTKSAVYAHYTNYLNYVYRKFRVKNAEMLRKNLKDYTNYKHLTKRFDAIRNIMAQTEEEISSLMRESGIESKTTLETFAKTFDIDDRKMYYNTLLRRKNELEAELGGFEEKQARIWEALSAVSGVSSEGYETDFNNDDAGVLERIVDAYIRHISAMMERAPGLVAEGESEGEGESVEPIVERKRAV